jgi:hypothetical protein
VVPSDPPCPNLLNWSAALFESFAVIVHSVGWRASSFSRKESRSRRWHGAWDLSSDRKGYWWSVFYMKRCGQQYYFDGGLLFYDGQLMFLMKRIIFPL